VAGLKEALESSTASANELTRSLFEEANWTASRVADFVNSTRNVTIATTNSSGQPHAAVVIGGCVDRPELSVGIASQRTVLTDRTVDHV